MKHSNTKDDLGYFHDAISTNNSSNNSSTNNNVNDSLKDSELDLNIKAESTITESWEGGYKLELGIKAIKDAMDWQLDLKLPEKEYKIRDVYGINIAKDDGVYTITGQNDQADLQQGELIKPILIIDHQSQTDSLPIINDNIVTTIIDVDDNDSDNDNNNDNNNKEKKGKYAYGEALQRSFLFYEANMSGELPESNRIEWRDDSTLNDGKDKGVNLEGGYFDAGDHIKFIQPTSFSTTMLSWSGIDYQSSYQQSNQFDELLETVKHATDWLLKCHEVDEKGETTKLWIQVGDASAHQQWTGAEEIDKVTDRKSYFIDRENPGSEAAAGAASALASAAILFKDVDSCYSQQLLKNAAALFDFAETYQAKYSDSVPEVNPFYTSYSGFYDELSLSATWLYKATGEQQYLNKAEEYFRNNIGGLGDWTYAADDHSYGAALLLSQEAKDNSFYKDQCQEWLDNWVEGGTNIDVTPDGLPVRFSWGSIPLALSASFSAQWYSDNIESNNAYEEFALEQVNYALGDNDEEFSYQVGFGDNYPLRPHHRGSAGTQPMNEDQTPNDNILYGALVGGPSSSNPSSYQDVRSDFITNEVGIGYNAPFTSSLIQQYNNFGGDPLSDSQLNSLDGISIPDL